MNTETPLRTVDPRSCFFITPAYDGRVEAGYAGGLAASAAAGLVGQFGFIISNSNISGARSKIAAQFKASKLDWLISIDSDIQFTANDLRYLLSVESDGDFMGQSVEYSRNEKGEELAVTAEYCKKNDAHEPVRFGMGFVRLHRTVFDKLDELQAEDGQELVGRYFDEGRIDSHYYPTISTTDSRLSPEDTSFWTYVRYAGIVPRIEQRTRLIHWGKKAYEYRGHGGFQ